MVPPFQEQTHPTSIRKAVNVQYSCNYCQLPKSVPDVSLRNNGCVAFAGKGESFGNIHLWEENSVVTVEVG
jgi:hypothetical protein